jgi:beta-glucosidase
MARVLFGDAEPGGRLPATFPLREADEPTAGDPEAYPGVAETVTYKEGVLIGYRWFDERKLGVAYPFGFGLSYTSFAFRNLRVTAAPDGAIGLTARIDVANTGRRSGTAVPQLYLGLPQPAPGVVQPPWQLKGFAKVSLRAGGARTVRIALDQRAFSYWDVRSGGWRVAPGCYGLMVGRSSREIARRATVAVGGASCPGAVARLPGRARRCTTRRRYAIQLRGVRRSQVRRVGVYLDGRRHATLRGPRRFAPVSLRRARAGLRTVRLVIRTRGGRRIVMTRRYRLCALPARNR